MTSDDDKKIIEIFKSRDAKETGVVLTSGAKYKVWNIAWGYDIGDEFAHITTNISPAQNDAQIDFFYTNDVKEIVDGDTDEIIISFSQTT